VLHRIESNQQGQTPKIQVTIMRIGSLSHSQDETAEANVTWCNPCWGISRCRHQCTIRIDLAIAKLDFNAAVSFAGSAAATRWIACGTAEA